MSAPAGAVGAGKGSTPQPRSPATPQPPSWPAPGPSDTLLRYVTVVGESTGCYGAVRRVSQGVPP